MSIRLIVNADDYGRSAGVSRGIRAAHLRGIVTSTTSMMNMPTVVDDLHIARKETPRLGLGVHLVLTTGKPVLSPEKVSSLTRPDGSFLGLEEFTQRCHAIDLDEVKAEWHAQVEAFVKASGQAPTHLDSHHHSSYFTAGLFRAMLELAKEYGAGLRRATSQGEQDEMEGGASETAESALTFAPRLLDEFKPRCPDIFFATFYDDQATKDVLTHIMQRFTEDHTYEIMCHPGYSDPNLIASSGYARQRDGELAILTSPEIQAEVKRLGIELINFSEL